MRRAARGSASPRPAYPTIVAKALGLQGRAVVWVISRLRLLDQRPMTWEPSTIPKLLAPDLGLYLEARDSRSLVRSAG